MQKETEFDYLLESVIREAINYGASLSTFYKNIVENDANILNFKVEEFKHRINELYSERFNNNSSYTFGD